MKHTFNKSKCPPASALFKALENNDSVMLLLLLKKGGDVNALSPAPGFFKKLVYETPYAPQSGLLHLAALAGNPMSLKILIRYGADVNAVNAEGQTALDYALTNLAHYEQKKQASSRILRLPFGRAAARAQVKVECYEGVVRTLLDAGARPGLFRLPEKFTPHAPSV